MVMSDIFLNEDIVKLFFNKFIVIIGDSIQRAIYKDMVLLMQKNLYLQDKHLRNKGEVSFEKDELIEGGKKGVMTNGISYKEVRQYHTENHLIRFYFVTRCYNTYMESILADLAKDPKPDVIIMNSCLWDISRYGSFGVEEYKRNLERLFRRFDEVLCQDCLLVWNSTLPISKNARGGFLIPEVEFMNCTLRLDILEANFYARQVVVAHGYDMLDLHYYMRNQLHRRAGDGVHWDQTAHRRITNLILTHVTEAWHEKLPGRIRGSHNTFSGKLNLSRGWSCPPDANNNLPCTANSGPASRPLPFSTASIPVPCSSTTTPPLPSSTGLAPGSTVPCQMLHSVSRPVPDTTSAIQQLNPTRTVFVNSDHNNNSCQSKSTTSQDPNKNRPFVIPKKSSIVTLDNDPYLDPHRTLPVQTQVVFNSPLFSLPTETKSYQTSSTSMQFMGNTDNPFKWAPYAQQSPQHGRSVSFFNHQNPYGNKSRKRKSCL